MEMQRKKTPLSHNYYKKSNLMKPLFPHDWGCLLSKNVAAVSLIIDWKHVKLIYEK